MTKIKQNTEIEQSELVESYAKFHKWQNRFTDEKPYEKEDENGDIVKKDPYESSQELEGWFDKVQEKHQKIRTLIGAMGFVQRIKIKEGVCQPNIEECKEKLHYIINYLPYYLKENNLDRLDLLKPMIGNTKTAKHLCNYVDKQMKTELLYSHIGSIIKEYAGDLQRIVSEAKTKPCEIFGSILTEAKYFSMLGHYGTDYVSCFSNSGSRPHHKFNLAKQKDSFIALVHTTEDFDEVDYSKLDLYSDEDEDKEDTPDYHIIKDRMWGFLTETQHNKVVNFCNNYKLDEWPDGNSLEVCRHLAATLLGISTDDIKLEYDLINISNELVWQNKKSNNWSFYTGRKPGEQCFMQ